MAERVLREGFDYPLSKLDPFGDHIDPPSVALYETLVVKGPDGERTVQAADFFQEFLMTDLGEFPVRGMVPGPNCAIG